MPLLSRGRFALGVCLALGVPEAYPWLVLGCVLVVGALYVRAQPSRRRRAA